MKKICWFSIIVLMSINSYGQVNHSQGTFLYHLPIHQYGDNKGLQLNTEISYYSGNGFRPNEASGVLGKNWMMTCGGVIQRIQNGEPDDQYSTDIFPGNDFSSTNDYFSQYNDYSYNRTSNSLANRNYLYNYYPNGYMYSEFTFDNGSNQPYPKEKTFSPRFTFDVNSSVAYKQSRRALADYQQDKFQFNFNGKVGSFLIGRYQDGTKRIFFESKHNLKVDFLIDNTLASAGIRTRIGSFIITDENGIRYTFSERVLQMVMENGADFENQVLAGTIPAPNEKPYYKGFNTSQFYPQTEMERFPPPTGGQNAGSMYIYYGDPNTNLSTTNYPVYFQRKAELRTRPYIVSTWLIKEIYNPQTDEKIVFNYEDVMRDYENEATVSMTDGIVSMQQNRVVTKDKQLKTVLFPNGEKLVFDYNTMSRKDNPSFSPLASITAYYKDQLVRTHEFGYGYLYKNQVIDYQTGMSITDAGEVRYLHLSLRSYRIKGKDGSAIPSKNFDYYLGNDSQIGDIVPPRNTWLLDWFGYYNNYSWDYASGSDLQYPPLQVLTGLLNNDQMFGRNPYLKRAQNGLLKSIQSEYGGITELEYEQNNWTNASGHVSLAGGVRVSKITKYNSDKTKALERQKYNYVLANGVTSGWGAEALSNIESLTYDFLWDKDSKYGTNIKTIQQMSRAINLYQNVLRPIYEAVNELIANSINNIRIDNLISRSQVIAAANAKLEALNADASAVGNTIGKAIMVVDPILQQNIRFYDGWSTELTKIILSVLGVRKSTTEVKVISTKSFYPVCLRNPLGLHYSRVEIYNDLENTGKRIFEYSKPSTATLTANEQFTNSFVPRLNFAFVDLLVLDEARDFSDKIVYQKRMPLDQSYEIVETTSNDLNFLSCGVEVTNIYSAPVVNYYDHKGAMNLHFTFPKTLSVNLKKIFEGKYVNGNLINESVAVFNYDTRGSIRETEVKGSDGTLYGQVYKYPFDYVSINTYAKASNDYNIVGQPVSVLSWVTPSGTSTKLLTAATFSSIEEAPNGQIRPSKNYYSEIRVPVASNLIVNGVDAISPTSSSIMKEGLSYVYDGRTLVATLPKNGQPSSVLYEDNKKFISNSTVQNALPAECRYTSFEGNNHNGWIFNEGNITVEKVGYTGVASYALASSITSNFNNTGIVRVLSFWAFGVPSVKANSILQTAVNNVQGHSGWQYFEYQLPVSTSTVEIAGSQHVYVDELRCYPMNARMETKAYGLFGIISACDINNRIVYYDYDGLGRVKAVRNHLFEIVKTFEYNFKQ